MASNQITLSYSESEWDKIESKTMKKNFQSYLISKINSIENIEDFCPACLDEVCALPVVKKFRIPSCSMVILSKIQEKTGKPFGTIVSKLIIDPLIYE